MRPWILIVAVLGAVAGTSWTQAAAPPAPKEQPPARRVIVDASLGRHIGVVSAIGSDEILYFDESGRPRTIQRADVLVILPRIRAAATSAEDPGPLTSADAALDLIELVNGELLPGQWTAPKVAGETIDWKSPLLGDLTLKLDDVRRIKRGGKSPAAPAATPAPAGDARQDTVTLTNGDVLSGFVDSIGDLVRIDVRGKTRDIDRSLVSEILLAGQGTPTAAPGSRTPGSAKAPTQMVWLTDGTSVLAENLISVGSTLSSITILRQGKTIEVSLAALDSWAPDRSRVIGLAGITPSKQTPVGDRSWAARIESGDRAVPLTAADLLLPGPMVVEWPLPAGATRLSMDAELPAASRVWGDCVLIVEIVGTTTREIARERLSDARPLAMMNLPLSQAGSKPQALTLRLTLDPGERGPIQDRVVLRQPLLLLGDAK
ncbi:MAG: hypothetical protein AABZ53_10870 [Planctomycetota bacterium]